MKQGFTLVELSIVLVILGLLVGGVLAGQSLIHAAELRAVSTEANSYKVALNAFREKYMGLPGDITNATAFWSAENSTPATCKTQPSDGPETCDGNGDGQFVYNGGTPDITEEWRGFQQLANAGLIEGKYDGAAGLGYRPGVNVPKSRFPSGMWGLLYYPGQAVYGHSPAKIGNYLRFGTVDASDAAAWGAPILIPEDAYNIDTKMDDGKPYSGIVSDLHDVTTPDCGTDDTNSAEFNLTLKTPACVLAVWYN